MTAIKEAIVVDVPVPVAYGQWTRFEEFPRFMEGVRRSASSTTRASTGRRTPRAARRLGRRDHRPGAGHADRLALDRRDAERRRGALRAGRRGSTRISVIMIHEDEGNVERAAGSLGLAERRVRGDLERFKELVESGNGDPSGGWREIHGGEVRNGDPDRTGPELSDDEPAGVGPEGYSAGGDPAPVPRAPARHGRTHDRRRQDRHRQGRVSRRRGPARALPRGEDGVVQRDNVVPIDDVTYVDGEDDTYVVVPYAADQIKNAPTFGDEDELTLERERAIYDHYQRVGYWEDTRDIVRARQTEPAPTPQIAEAEVADAIRRGDDPRRVRVRRWGA